jgi:hypothetical protein
VLHTAQFEIAQLPVRDLQSGEGIDRRRHVAGAEQGKEQALVVAKHAHAPRDRLRRPRGQPVGAGSQAEPGGKHWVVGQEIIEETLDDRLGGVHPGLSRRAAAGKRSGARGGPP